MLLTHLLDEAKDILMNFANELEQLNDWNLDNIKQFIKDFCRNHGIKMPQLGMPIRIKLLGNNPLPNVPPFDIEPFSPPFDALVYILERDEVLKRIRSK